MNPIIANECTLAFGNSGDLLILVTSPVFFYVHTTLSNARR
jgi:hypothetical protein